MGLCVFIFFLCLYWFCASYNDYKFASRLIFCKVGLNLSKCAAHRFFMYFADFSAYGATTLTPENFAKLLEEFYYAVGTLIKYYGTFLFS